MHLERQHRRRLAALALAAGALAAGAARAEDDYRPLSPAVRPAALPARGAPVDGIEWERRLRPPDRFGPARLREADAALLAAARGARWGEALQLLKSGRAGANVRDELGANALVLAARAGQDDLVRELVKRGAELDRLGEDGFTALGAAALAGHRSTLRLLVLAGADPARLGAGGQAPLHLASLAGQMDTLDELLRLKVDIELLNRQRESAVDVAAAVGQQAVMSRLIDAGADLSRAGQR